MGNKVNIGLRGLEDLIKSLDGNVKKMRAVMKPAIQAGAEVLEQEAKARVRVRRGVLKALIRARTGVQKRAYIRMHVSAGADGAYANPLESGHEPSGLFAHMDKDVQPYPFMAPTFDAKVAAAERAITDKLRESIR